MVVCALLWSEEVAGCLLVNERATTVRNTSVERSEHCIVEEGLSDHGRTSDIHSIQQRFR